MCFKSGMNEKNIACDKSKLFSLVTSNKLIFCSVCLFWDMPPNQCVGSHACTRQRKQSKRCGKNHNFFRFNSRTPFSWSLSCNSKAPFFFSHPSRNNAVGSKHTKSDLSRCSFSINKITRWKMRKPHRASHNYTKCVGFLETFVNARLFAQFSVLLNRIYN